LKLLGNTHDGTQAEYVRVPHATTSVFQVPKGDVDEETMVFISDILPTGLECGTLNARVQPGSNVAIVGAGPVGLCALLTAQLYNPSQIIVIDRDDNRLRMAIELGATDVVNSAKEDAVEFVKSRTDGLGADSVMEAVGLPPTFHLCQEIVAPGGVIANIGVHGATVELHLEKLWAYNLSQCLDSIVTESH
jgi:alcohol dehydrogenase